MKYIKLFESKDKPKVGDYVICDESEAYIPGNELDNELDIFLSKNIGRVVNYDSEMKIEYMVQYENIPKNLELNYFSLGDSYDGGFKRCREMARDEIKFWNSDKETVEAALNAQKYNL